MSRTILNNVCAAGSVVTMAALGFSSLGGLRGNIRAAEGPDCAEPVCDDKLDMFAKAMGGKGPGGATKECPVGRAELGRQSWTLLHTTAAYYPHKPSQEQSDAAQNLVHALSVLYPCGHCREHLAAHVEENPPDTSSREAFSVWMCNTHNAVNEVLGKPIFECSAEKLDERWRSGCKSVQPSKAKASPNSPAKTP
mmetsp:Transcript_2289/g.3816  ORF Transcript_2289/g.3816 Transcript_2289/m.3816 type:complete len:195 (+) Transcript_2289:67-651(+)